MESMQIQKLEKEEVVNQKLISTETEKGAEALKTRLKSALRLGNEFKGKTLIVFMTDEGPKSIETTIWSLTENFIQIKHGVAIPINSIISVDY